jgi:hypothetical protein
MHNLGYAYFNWNVTLFRGFYPRQNFWNKHKHTREISRLQCKKKITDLGSSNVDKYMNDETCRFPLNKILYVYLLEGWVVLCTLKHFNWSCPFCLFSFFSSWSFLFYLIFFYFYIMRWNVKSKMFTYEGCPKSSWTCAVFCKW